MIYSEIKRNGKFLKHHYTPITKGLIIQHHYMYIPIYTDIKTINKVFVISTDIKRYEYQSRLQFFNLLYLLYKYYNSFIIHRDQARTGALWRTFGLRVHYVTVPRRCRGAGGNSFGFKCRK